MNVFSSPINYFYIDNIQEQNWISHLRILFKITFFSSLIEITLFTVVYEGALFPRCITLSFKIKLMRQMDFFNTSV